MSTVPVTSWGDALLTSLTSALALLLDGIPKILAFLVILIIGWFIASAIAAAVAALLRAVRFNDLARRSGFAGFVERGSRAPLAGEAPATDSRRFIFKFCVDIPRPEPLNIPDQAHPSRAIEPIATEMITHRSMNPRDGIILDRSSLGATRSLVTRVVSS